MGLHVCYCGRKLACYWIHNHSPVCFQGIIPAKVILYCCLKNSYWPVNNWMKSSYDFVSTNRITVSNLKCQAHCIFLPPLNSFSAAVSWAPICRNADCSSDNWVGFFFSSAMCSLFLWVSDVPLWHWELCARGLRTVYSFMKGTETNCPHSMLYAICSKRPLVDWITHWHKWVQLPPWLSPTHASTEFDLLCWM